MTHLANPTTGRQPAAGRSSVTRPTDDKASKPGARGGKTRTLLEEDGGVIRRTVLPSGLRVITEQVPGQRSATIGVWVGVGSRDESPSLHGCSHFLEHLLFKGTPERSALDISIALDAVGGEFNAFTAKEYTCFHARVLDEDLPLAIDVLGDMITSSTISAEDVEAERDVILDEIAMHDDDPDDVVHNLFAEQAYGTSPLGRTISGTDESIAKRLYANPESKEARLDRGLDESMDASDPPASTQPVHSHGGAKPGEPVPSSGYDEKAEARLAKGEPQGLIGKIAQKLGID